MPDDLNTMLRDFLAEQRRIDVGGSINSLRAHMLKHDADNQVRHAEIRGDLGKLSIRVAALEKDVIGLETQELDEAKWWKRGILGAIGAALLAVTTWFIQRGIK